MELGRGRVGQHGSWKWSKVKEGTTAEELGATDNPKVEVVEGVVGGVGRAVGGQKS